MKSEHSFPFSVKEMASAQVSGPSRFARALKQARFARGWTQADLAAQTSLPKRSIISWETAERIPSVGIVVLLLDALIPEKEWSLHHELLFSYIADDLERQESRKDQRQQRQQDDPFFLRVHRVLQRVLQLPTSLKQEEVAKELRVAEQRAPSHVSEPIQSPKSSEQQALEPLFALMTQLHQHPELIPVASDFIRELAPGG